jgi:pimeloyl-ACP methyl ester carboxylesterase
MSNQRTHHVTTTDGVTIGATVHGHGPPLVFLQGLIGDGDLDWQGLLPHLTDRFTCHLPSMRGRGLSGDHPDLGTGRIAADYVTYVDTIGEPCGLVGWSGGASQTLAVAAQSDLVSAVAPWEPVAASTFDEQTQAAVGEALARTGQLAAEGNLTAAVRAFARFPFTDQEVGVAGDVGYLGNAARYVPNLLNLFGQMLAEDEAPVVDDPAALGTISAPVLVLTGSDTKPFFVTSARHVVDHIPNARMREVPGVGHAAPLTHPAALAEALTEFFAPAEQPA